MMAALVVHQVNWLLAFARVVTELDRSELPYVRRWHTTSERLRRMPRRPRERSANPASWKRYFDPLGVHLQQELLADPARQEVQYREWPVDRNRASFHTSGKTERQPGSQCRKTCMTIHPVRPRNSYAVFPTASDLRVPDLAAIKSVSFAAPEEPPSN